MEIEQPTPTTKQTQERSIFSAEIEEMLERERKYRQENQHHHSVTILKEIIQLVFDTQKYQDLNELLELLAKKRGQPVKAQVEMVRLTMTFIDKITDLETKMALIQTVKTVCEKKIYLEVEYARCCLMIVKNQETNENIEEAARIMQNVQVETYGSMDAREKLEFILYQMRIMVKKQDFVRLLIVSRKIGPKSFDPPNVEDLKVVFCTYMHILLHHDHKYLEASKHFDRVLKTLTKGSEELKNLPEVTEFGYSFERAQLFGQMVFYAAQAPASSERTAVLKRYASEYSEELDSYPSLRSLVDGLLGKELISCDIGTFGADQASLYQEGKDESSTLHRKALRKMLIQHNVLVVSTYYRRISLPRCEQLFGVPSEDVELELCEMINESQVTAKIDRLEKVISFKMVRGDDEILDEWVTDVNKLLTLVDETCNLIHREEEKYGSRPAGPSGQAGQDTRATTVTATAQENNKFINQ